MKVLLTSDYKRGEKLIKKGLVIDVLPEKAYEMAMLGVCENKPVEESIKEIIKKSSKKNLKEGK